MRAKQLPWVSLGGVGNQAGTHRGKTPAGPRLGAGPRQRSLATRVPAVLWRRALRPSLLAIWSALQIGDPSPITQTASVNTTFIVVQTATRGE